MVIWIIGLSASGKTTLGKYLYEEIKKDSPSTVFVDGDQIRKIFKHDKGNDPYSLPGRRINADRICELCAWLDKQGINVVCCILSVFEESREWNRSNYSDYFEVYIDTPVEKLRQRETKGLYAAAFAGEIKDVVGVDIEFKPPKNPDYVLDNSKDNIDFEQVALNIIKKINQREK